jgi:Uma2 family endonuclease
MSSRTIPAMRNEPSNAIPPLEPGDRLTRDEFERRYEAMPPGTKAELIERVVLVHSRKRFYGHGVPARHLNACMGVYQATTPGVTGANNATVRLDPDNEFQPDGLLLIDPALGGQARISVDDYIENAPELVAEISASTVSIDLNTKFHVYRRNQVREYIVWRVLDKEIDWFILRQGRFDRLLPGADGLLRSEVFPGLWLDADALVRGDLARVLAVVQRGVASPQHAAFVAKLQQNAGK